MASQLLQQTTEFLLRFAVSSPLPASWLYDVPKSSEIDNTNGELKHIEIVSHCWNYSHLFVYQLRSLIENAPKDYKVTFTGFYCHEDTATAELVAEYTDKQVANIEWNFIALDKGDLLRRGIGRNIAAKNTRADWIWFTDCDLLFGENTFSSLHQVLSNESGILAFPETVARTSLLSNDHEVLSNAGETKVDEQLQEDDFTLHTFSKATGPVQIARGDIAREYGYCDQINCYQQPKDRWVKTYEDRAFRWLLGTPGNPVSIDDVAIIRHVEKGRYKQNSTFSEMRKANRRAKDKLLAK